MVAKSTYDEKPHLEILQKCFAGLKEAMETLDCKSCSISRKGNGLERLSWKRVEEILRNVFGESDIILNICTNEVRIPGLEDQYKIIEENHSSTPGGHLGIAKTYLRLKKQFYWDGRSVKVAPPHRKSTIYFSLEFWAFFGLFLGTDKKF